MGYSNISATLAQADVDAVKAAIGTINAKLPFLITLTPDEEKSLFKLGPKSVDFASDARDTVNNFSQIFPSTFNKTEFLKDVELFRQLTEIKLLVDSLSEKLDDTYNAVGAESMTAALEVYAHVQINQDKVPGLKSVSEKLGQRFKKSKSPKKPE